MSLADSVLHEHSMGHLPRRARVQRTHKAVLPHQAGPPAGPPGTSPRRTTSLPGPGVCEPLCRCALWGATAGTPVTTLYLEERGGMRPFQGLLQTEGEQHLGLCVPEHVVLLVWKTEPPTQNSADSRGTRHRIRPRGLLAAGQGHVARGSPPTPGNR